MCFQHRWVSKVDAYVYVYFSLSRGYWGGGLDAIYHPWSSVPWSNLLHPNHYLLQWQSNTAMMQKTTSCHEGIQVDLCLDHRVLSVCAVAWAPTTVHTCTYVCMYVVGVCQCSLDVHKWSTHTHLFIYNQFYITNSLALCSDSSLMSWGVGYINSRARAALCDSINLFNSL